MGFCCMGVGVVDRFVKSFLQVINVDVRDVRVEIDVDVQRCEEAVEEVFNELEEGERRSLGVGVSRLREVCRDVEFLNVVKKLVEKIVEEALVSYMNTDDFVDDVNDIVENELTLEDPEFNTLVTKITQLIEQEKQKTEQKLEEEKKTEEKTTEQKPSSSSTSRRRRGVKR